MANIDELINKLAKDGKAVKPAHHPALLSLEWITVAVFYIAIALMISGLRTDLMAKLNEPWFAAEIATLAGIVVATSLSAALLSFPDLHQMRRVALLPAITFALFALVMFIAWRTDSPPTPPPMHSFQCTLMISMLAILPAVWIFFVMRRYASTHQYWAGGIAMLAAFSVGALWLRLHEQTDSIMHVIEWHYLPMIFVGLIGMWLGKLILKW
jgi:hypothetical protein